MLHCESLVHTVCLSGHTLAQVVTLPDAQAALPTVQVPVVFKGQSVLVAHCWVVWPPAAFKQTEYAAHGVLVLLQVLLPYVHL